MEGHNCISIVLRIAVALVYVATLIIYGVGNALRGVLFESTIGERSDQYDTKITPSSWVFGIWNFIFTWQFLWIVYSIVNICRGTKNGPVYQNPVLLTPVYFIFYLLNLTAMIVWAFMIDRELLTVAFGALFVIAAALYVCMFIAYRELYKSGYQLVQEGRHVDIWLHRLFVHNGLGIYATWTTIATLLNLIMMSSYEAKPPLSLETAGTIALGFLTVIYAVFVGTDLVFLDNYSRYTYTPYIVVPVALGGSYENNYEPNTTNSIFTLVLLGISVFFAVVKIIVMLYRHFTKPLYQTQVFKDTLVEKS